jgi:hypothetical protein
MSVRPTQNSLVTVTEVNRNLESPIAYGTKAKVVAILYLAFMLGLMSIITLPDNLFAAVPLIMFIVNSCLLFLLYSDLRIFATSVIGPMGTAVLTAIGAQSALFVALTEGKVRWLSFMVIPLIFLIFILFNRGVRSPSNVAIRVIDVIVLATVSTCTAILTLFLRISHPLDTVQGFVNLPTDIPLFGTMIQSIVANGVSETGFVAGYPLKYHWLSYGFLGSLDQGSPLDLIPLLVLFTPILLFFASLLLVASISSVTWMPPLSPVLGILGVLSLGFVGVWRNADIPIFPWFSPSTLLGGALLLALSLIVQRSITTGVNWGGFSLVIVLSSFLFLAKISAGVIFLLGLCLISFYLWVSGRRFPREAASLVVVVGIIGSLLYLFTFSGTGNEIQLEPALSEFSPAEIGSIVSLGVPLAALVAILAPWAGVLIRGSSGGKLELEQAWAVCLGLPALAIYSMTTAPDQNDRFFIIAASIVIFPISFLTTVKFLTSRFSRSQRKRLFMFFALTSSASIFLYIFSNMEFFDLRPLVFPFLTFILAASLGLIFGLRNTNGSGKRKTYLNSCLASLVVVSFFFSVFQFVGQTLNIPFKDHVEYISPSAQERIEKYIGLTLKQSLVYTAVDGMTISFLVLGQESNTIERWVRFVSSEPSFSSGETDVRRLSSEESEAVVLERNKEILEFYKNESSTLENKLCMDGLSEIWVYPNEEKIPGPDSSTQILPQYLRVLSLDCPPDRFK